MAKKNQSLDQIPSVYNFVPPAPQIIYPEWAHRVSHDRPFEDGLSGDLTIELKTQSPLMICDAKDKNPQGVLKFYKDAQGKYAVPGTSLRGMLRSVLEIATWGKMDLMNNDTFGLRDLNVRHLYGDYMADVQKTRQGRAPMPLVNAGWLYKYYDNNVDEVRYRIAPCHFAKVEYTHLVKFGRQLKINADPNRKQSAVQKYKAWGTHAEKTYRLPILKLLSRGDLSARAKVKRLSDFGELKGGPASDHQSGRFVFTGQPQERRPGEKRKKHHDFFFYDFTPDEHLDIDPKLFRAFEQIHSDGAEQHRNEINPNEEWGYWKRKMRGFSEVELNAEGKAINLDACRQVPIFFIVEPEDFKRDTQNVYHRSGPVLKSFGLAMMFRLAYNQSLHDVRDRTAGQSGRKVQDADFAQTLFGYTVSEDDKKRLKDLEGGSMNPQGLRGRVSIGQAALQGHAQTASVVKAVLSSPKPTFYPAYIQQGNGPGSRPPGQDKGKGWKWTAYMHDRKDSTQNPKLRGWKRYLARNQWDKKPTLPSKASEKVMTAFEPLKEGTTFTFKMRLHNVRPIELGALLWCLDFGGLTQATHQLGMGKPLGYGRVRLKVKAYDLEVNGSFEDCEFGSPLSQSHLDRCLAQFKGYMQGKSFKKWAESDTIRELRACALAHPSGQDPDTIRQPMIDHPVNRNEFQSLKKSGAALPLQGSDPEYKNALRQFTEEKIEVYQDDRFKWSQLEHDLMEEHPVETEEEVIPSSGSSSSGSSSSGSSSSGSSPAKSTAASSTSAAADLPTEVECQFDVIKRVREIRKSRAKSIKGNKVPKSSKVVVRGMAPWNENPKLIRFYFESEAIENKDEFWEEVRLMDGMVPVKLVLSWEGGEPVVRRANLIKK